MEPAIFSLPTASATGLRESAPRQAGFQLLQEMEAGLLVETADLLSEQDSISLRGLQLINRAICSSQILLTIEFAESMQEQGSSLQSPAPARPVSAETTALPQAPLSIFHQ